VSRRVSITLGEEDLKIIKNLQEKEGWSRSRAIQHIVRLIGSILQQGIIDIEGEVSEISEIPDKCPKCDAKLLQRAPLYDYNEIYECENNHLFRAIYTVTAFRELKEK